MTKKKSSQLQLSLQLTTALGLPQGASVTPAELKAKIEEHTRPVETRTGWGVTLIGEDAVRYALTLGPDVSEREGVTGSATSVSVSYSEGTLHFSIRGRKAKDRMLEVKHKVGLYLIATYPDRKFFHAKHKGFKVWWWNYADEPEGLRCGSEIGLTPEEKEAQRYGGLKAFGKRINGKVA